MLWLCGLWILLLTAGYAKLSTMLVNRLLAIPQSKLLIAATELVQISTIPVYSALLTYGYLKSSSGLSTPSAFAMSSTEMLLIAIGAIGFVFLVRSTIAYQCYRFPACQIDSKSKIVDFRKADSDLPWQETLVGPQPMRRIALLPGNEQFTVEVSTRSYRLPGLPDEWDGLSLVHLADTHFRGAATRAYFEAVCEQAAKLNPDMFVFTGDLLDDPSLLDWVPATFGQLKAPHGQYFILGNHDWYQDSAAIRKEFERYEWVDLSSRWMHLASLTSGPPIILAGDETPWMGHHPDLSDVSDDHFRILLSHTPDNILWARDQEFDLMLAGHTHGGQIRLPLLGPVYSPSRFGCRFASGVFWLDPTLLCVSRGISGREPIRYNCAPELTKIVLHSR